MKNVLSKTFMVLALSAMAACSSGGSSSPTNPSVPNPDTGTGGGDTGTGGGDTGTGGNNPASEQPADLAKFAVDQNNFYAGKGGTRVYVATAEDGREVSYTTVPGFGNNGLVRLDRENRLAKFGVTGTGGDVLNVQSGVYTGTLQTSYRHGQDAEVASLQGNMALEMDFEKGEGYMDSIVGNSRKNIEVMGTVKVEDGRLKNDSMVARVRDGDGYFLFDAANNLDATVSGSGTNSAIFGTVNARDNAHDFEMTGGFAATYDPQYN